MVIMENYYIQDRLSDLWNKIDELHMTFLDVEESPEKIEIRSKLEELIKEYLCIPSHNQKFSLQVTHDVLYRSAHDTFNFSGYKAATGFNALQLYAGNLFSQPWRREYKKIRKYSGFYKHQVEANLTKGELLLEAMGYKPIGQSTLQLDGPIGPDRVMNVSKDCLIAYVECQILKFIWEEIASSGINISWKDILDFRQTHLCSPEQSITSLKYQYHQTLFRKNSQGNIPIHHGLSTYSNPPLPAPSSHGPPVLLTQYLYGTNGCCPNSCMAHAQMHSSHPSVLPYPTQSMMKPQFNTNGYYYSNGPTPQNLIYNSSVPIAQLIELEPHNSYDMDDRPCHSRSTMRSHNMSEPCATHHDEDLMARDSDKTDSQFEDWEYVYKTLDSQRYNKDLGERGDVLIGNVDGKFRRDIKNSDKKKKDKDPKKTKLSSVDLPINNLTISNKPKQKGAPKLKKASEVKPQVSPASSYDNITPSEKKQLGKVSNLTISKSKITNLDKTNSGTSLVKLPKKDDKQKQKETKPDSSLWQCKTCTYLNPSTRTICEMCDKSKTNIEEDVEVGGAECVHCTLVNPKDAKTCKVCAKSLENSPTRV